MIAPRARVFLEILRIAEELDRIRSSGLGLDAGSRKLKGVALVGHRICLWCVSCCEEWTTIPKLHKLMGSNDILVFGTHRTIVAVTFRQTWLVVMLIKLRCCSTRFV
jgi:hypothetical protein